MRRGEEEQVSLTEEQRHVLPKRDGKRPYAFMIVDDSDFMVNQLKRIILSFEAEVVAVAGDGADAVVKFGDLAEKPDIVTMDLTMPKMGGLDAARAILASAPDQKIVVVSALGQKDVVQKAIVLGAKHFVVKPFQRDDIYRVFRQTLGLKPAGAA